MSDEERLERKKACNRASHQKYKERRNAEALAKYHANREAIRAERKAWAAKNPDKVRAQSRRNRAKHGEKLRERRRQHYRENKAQYVANARSREKHFKQATPRWADMEAIEAFYIEAERLTLETGIKHHVDHAYPLRSKVMCGLHVEGNLRIIPAIDNLRKGNRVIVEMEASL